MLTARQRGESGTWLHWDKRTQLLGSLFLLRIESSIYMSVFRRYSLTRWRHDMTTATTTTATHIILSSITNNHIQIGLPARSLDALPDPTLPLVFFPVSLPSSTMLSIASFASFIPFPSLPLLFDIFFHSCRERVLNSFYLCMFYVVFLLPPIFWSYYRDPAPFLP